MVTKDTSVFSAKISAFSSISFGTFLTSVGVLYPTLQDEYNRLDFKYSFDLYFSLVATIIFFGAFLSSYFIFIFNSITKRNLLIINNFIYLAGIGVLFLIKNVYTALLSRFIIGFGAGITCCTVPAYIFSISNDKNRGFLMSFNSIGIVVGLILGKTLDVFIGHERWQKVFMIIGSFILFHSGLLCIIQNPDEIVSKEKTATILDLFKNSKSYKSIFLALSFHIAQHATGIDYFSLFVDRFFKDDVSKGIKGIGCLCFSATICIISSGFVDRIGRKILIIFSSFLMGISTFLMGLGYIKLPVIFIYLFGFNAGMSSIPWFIVNEIFPFEYFNAAMRLCVGANWLSAFVLAFSLELLHKRYGNFIYFFYSSSMFIFILIVLFVFKETKNKPAGFQ